MITQNYGPESVPQHIEKDIENISVHLEKQKNLPEAKSISGQEKVKQSIKSYVATTPAPASTQAQSDDYLPSYMKDSPADEKLEVEHLLGMAFREGLLKANAAAMRSTPFIIDAFHDAMAGRLYPELKKRGLVD